MNPILKQLLHLCAPKRRMLFGFGLESGPTATWLWTELKRLGVPVICIDARHAKAVLKMQINKSHRNDVVGIARIMQTGWLYDRAWHRANHCTLLQGDNR